MFRVQKVLLAEYREIYEPVLVESPFTLVDAEGNGLRQYQIALTANKLFFGSDNYDKHQQHNEPNYYLGPGLDPEIECFDLICLVPLEFIRFHFYRKGERYVMMLGVQQLQAKHLLFLEFGGHIHKQYFWHTWRESISSISCQRPEGCHITARSPYSSSDVLVEDEVHQAQVHRVPTRSLQSVYSRCYSCSSSGGAA